MFSQCSNLNNFVISNFNTEKVTNLDSMFYQCSNNTI